jgi:hypothetical protein
MGTQQETIAQLEIASCNVGSRRTVAVTVFVTRLAGKTLAKKIRASETGHNAQTV